MELIVDVRCDKNEFLKILTDYESLTNYLPVQLKKIEILEKEGKFTTVEMVLVFKTIVKKEISVKIEIEEKSENEIECRVLDGHAKDTIIIVHVNQIENKTQIKTEIDLKLSLKAKILSPIIKKNYKNIIRGIFMRMALDAEKKLDVN